MKEKFSDVFKKLRIKNKYTQEEIANKFEYLIGKRVNPNHH